MALIEEVNERFVVLTVTILYVVDHSTIHREQMQPKTGPGVKRPASEN